MSTATVDGIYLDAALTHDAHEILVLRLTALARSLTSRDEWPTTVWNRVPMVARAARAVQQVSLGAGRDSNRVLLDGGDIEALRDAAVEVAATYGDMATDSILVASATKGDPLSIRDRDHYGRIAAAAERLLDTLEGVA